MHTLIQAVAIFALMQNAEGGQTSNGFLQSIPRDPASIFALLVIIVGAGAVMWFGRPKGNGNETTD
ncbi:MAG: hypothetical protein U5R14_11925 [Gemmatimonadota bacterium]|nr:hypothetical protein [Gemmatimonadota bacterium]